MGISESRDWCLQHQSDFHKRMLGATGKTAHLLPENHVLAFQSSNIHNSFRCPSAFWIWVMKVPLLGFKPAGRDFEKWGPHPPTPNPCVTRESMMRTVLTKGLLTLLHYDSFKMLICSLWNVILFPILSVFSVLCSLFAALFALLLMFGYFLRFLVILS